MHPLGFRPRRFCVSVSLAFGLSAPAVVQAEAPPAAPNLVAVGHGLDVGLIGVRYARRVSDGLFSLGGGIGLAGLGPKLAVHPVAFGTWNLTAAIGLLYSPIENPLFAQGALLSFGTVGIQRWAYRSDDLSLFVHASVGMAKLLRGNAEGGMRDLEPTVELQLGLTF